MKYFEFNLNIFYEILWTEFLYKIRSFKELPKYFLAQTENISETAKPV